MKISDTQIFQLLKKIQILKMLCLLHIIDSFFNNNNNIKLLQRKLKFLVIADGSINYLTFPVSKKM